MSRFRFPINDTGIPKNGIYILFEDGEFGHGMDRIVRVGTHTGNDQLRSRLKQHFVNENKDRSIFRKNIGRALLAKENDAFLEQWEWDLTTRSAKEKLLPQLDVSRQKEVEKLVSAYIQQKFSFAVFQVIEKDRRLDWEQKIISSVSWCVECGPSSQWLGLNSPKAKIRESGLWLVNGLYKKELNTAELKEIEKKIHT